MDVKEKPMRRKSAKRAVLYFYPLKHLHDGLRLEKANTGKTFKRLLNESLALKLGLPLNPEALMAGKQAENASKPVTDFKYPIHDSRSH